MIDTSPPLARDSQRVVDGPNRTRSEIWWRVEVDGRRYRLGQLQSELADDEALRRRYVRDAEKRAGLEVPGVAAIVAIGPSPDPRDPAAAPPWRLREDPAGESLADVFKRRAPLPVDEAIELVLALAEVVHGVHQAGVVLRDLEPRNIIVTGGEPAVVLGDVGLARVDMLSTRSASSLMLEGSAYAAPEHLLATVIDSRADIYTLGVILWEALTGSTPFAETGAFYRDRAPLPTLASLGIEAPAGLDELIAACLEDEPADRPESARDIADALAGRAAPRASGDRLALALVVCQSCGETLRPGLRLCLACGKQAVQFAHASGDGARYEIRLMKAREDAEFVAKLAAFFETVGEGPVPELSFLIGDMLLYSRAERERLHKIPATLIDDLTKETAEALAKRLIDEGFKVRVVRSRRKPSRAGRNLIVGGLIAGVAGVAAAAFAPVAVAVPLIIGGVFAALIGVATTAHAKKKGKTRALAGLRKAPAALPASDPLIVRLGALLNAEPGDKLGKDVRDRVAEIALLVQRLVDHRAAAEGDGESADLDRLTEPVEPIIALVEREVAALRECDAGLADLDEGKLVRAIASSEARDEPRAVRAHFYTGLDTMRDLEDRRGQHMERLLEASSLMRRLTQLGLGKKSEAAEAGRLLEMARAALD